MPQYNKGMKIFVAYLLLFAPLFVFADSQHFRFSNFDYGGVQVGQSDIRDLNLTHIGGSGGIGGSVQVNSPFSCEQGCNVNFNSSPSDSTISIKFKFAPSTSGRVSSDVVVAGENVGTLSGTGNPVGGGSPGGSPPPGPSPSPSPPAPGSRASGCDPTQGQICNPLEAQDLQGLIDTILNIIFKASFVVMPFIVIVAGFTMVTADGNMKQVTKGRDILLWAVIGFTIILISKGLSTILLNILKGS